MPQKQISFVQIETGFLCDIGCGDSGRVIRLFARMIEQLGLRTPSTTAVSGAAKRRAECTSLGPGLKHPSLRGLTLVWAARDVPRHFS